MVLLKFYCVANKYQFLHYHIISSTNECVMIYNRINDSLCIRYVANYLLIDLDSS